MSTDARRRQGGDLRGLGAIQLDLSTCVNRYGPPDAVVQALRDMLSADAVRRHPYGAAEDVETAYASYTGQPAAEFTAGRGASDLIWTLARHLDGKRIALPMPAYTEFRRAFPQARPFGGGASTHPAEVLDEAMRDCDAVIISNPHNPTGQVITRTDLAAVAAAHPACLLVVDESYIDFLAAPGPITLIGCGLGNVIVLRSPSKFFGLAGARSGAAWSCHPLPRQWRRTQTSWPVSAFAATALQAALTGSSWATSTRQLLAGDTAWLTGTLTRSGLDITPGLLHFRLLTGTSRTITRFASQLRASGIAVRVLDEAYGAGQPAVRISAPRRQDQPTLSAALQAMQERP
jgi:histidinol-phosphate/aromatic aminotransferase/cobyric acid decarboxylase-like protein